MILILRDRSLAPKYLYGILRYTYAFLIISEFCVGIWYRSLQRLRRIFCNVDSGPSRVNNLQIVG